MRKHRKNWNRKKEIITLVGSCKYCREEVLNTDSFVSFFQSGHAHYECMRKDADDKTYENEVKT